MTKLFRDLAILFFAISRIFTALGAEPPRPHAKPVVAKRIPADMPDIRSGAIAIQPSLSPLLSANGFEALKVSADWQSKSSQPVLGPDGSVQYLYGAGLPELVCAPLRICIVELERGEKLLGEPQLGDNVRWNMAPAAFGTGPTTTPAIALKPQDPGLDTSLFITTDRRPYYLRLISSANINEYIARVSFRYPEAEKAKWQPLMAADVQKPVRSVLRPRTPDVADLNFGYSIKGRNKHIRPTRVYDNGAKTFLQMPADIGHWEAPALLVFGDDGKGIMTNYRVNGTIYVVDRLFDRAELRLGTGRRAKKNTVEVIRNAKS